MGLSLPFLLPLLVPQDPPPAVPTLHPEVVLSDAADPIPLAAFGLGDGGVAPRFAPGQRWSDGGCITPGGVRIEVRAVGVKLTFPSGRELLLAPDGLLHLRSGETGGPWPAGVELRLGDGSAVRVVLAPGNDDRLREVVVVHGEVAAALWRKGRPAKAVDDPRPWAGKKLACCGDGGDVYRVIGLGPLLVLDRVLVADSRTALLPTERLVLLTAPLSAALQAMPKQHTGTDAPLRRAVAVVTATARRSAEVLPAGAALQRVERQELRWVLPSRHELLLALDDGSRPQLSLFLPGAKRPLVDWTLGGNGAAFLVNPFDAQPGNPRWTGNGTRLAPIATDLLARDELFETGEALAVLRRLMK